MNIQKLIYKNSYDGKGMNTIPIQLKILDNNENRMYLIHKALKQQLKNNRKRNAHSKTRSEVRGGGKKPWKQKGTGRARAGSNRSPLWRGGGVIFGPKNKQYKSKINKKEKRLAINTALANKFANTVVIKEILPNITIPSTKIAIAEIKKYGIQIEENKKYLIIVHQKTKMLHLSLRNIRNIELIEAHSINILCLLKTDIIIMTKDALKLIK
uniref:Large ribosomal subunit protein uL4c n=1 Tax=Pleurostichidium falkenbergii TaxID=121064 RepID=A0A4D6UXI5_9FLOR|nr:ribosomal protein L4 [Pleurostichidium falkenbergii]QCH39695.1 ribosomal protein L4 [Pleurostichidium falkenbergii]